MDIARPRTPPPLSDEAIASALVACGIAVETDETGSWVGYKELGTSPTATALPPTRRPALQKKTHACTHCERVFGRKVDLQRHLSAVHGLGERSSPRTRDQVCTYCCKAFDRRSDLERHIRIHTQERPFACQYCGKGFIQTSALKIHLRTHTGEKPHPCQQCSRSFADSSSLKRHQRSHSGERPYVCQDCPDQSYSKKTALTAHLSTCHAQMQEAQETFLSDQRFRYCPYTLPGIV